MSRDPLDRELSQALRQQTDAASPGFTAAVLARIEHRPRRSLMFRYPALAAAAAMILVALGVTLGLNLGERPSEIADERQQLLREYTELQRELDQIRQLADESGPVLYLGGDETFEVMYDLRGYEDPRSTSGVRPASLPPDRG